MLIVAESAGQRLTAFTLMPGGTLCGRRTWASFGEPATAASVPEALAQVQVWPDGIALDAAGAAWVADPLGREVFRVREDGQITDRISTPGARCVACARRPGRSHPVPVHRAARLDRGAAAREPPGRAAHRPRRHAGSRRFPQQQQPIADPHRGVVRRASWFCAMPIMLPCGSRRVTAGSGSGSELPP